MHLTVQRAGKGGKTRILAGKRGDKWVNLLIRSNNRHRALIIAFSGLYQAKDVAMTR
jgi:hypothetical protein